MAERETQVLFKGKMVPGREVPVSGGTQKWSEFELEDGTIIRAKVDIITAVRVKDQYDPVGNPVYVLNAAPVIGVVHTPTELRKKDQE